MIDSAKLKQHIEEFARTVSDRPLLGLASHRPEEGAEPTQCFANAQRKAQKDGGRVLYGWMFQYREVPGIPGPGYLIAINHAVWNAPDGRLVDVTPFHPDPLHHPYAPGGSVLFLVDGHAKPTIAAPLPSRFVALGKNLRLASHVRRLNREEKDRYQKLGG